MKTPPLIHQNILKVCLLVAAATTLSASAAVLYDDNNFSTFPTGWVLTTPSGTSAVLSNNVPAGSSNTNSLHLTDNSTTGLLVARANFSSVYTGTELITISYSFSTLNIMSGGTAQYASSLFRLLSDTGAGAFNLQVAKSPGGTESSRQTWGSGNGSALENVYLDPGQWYKITIELPAPNTAGSYSATIAGLNGAQVYGYNAPYSPASSFSFSKSMSPIANYGAIEFSSNYGNEPLSDIYYTDIEVSSVPEPSVLSALVLTSVGGLLLLRKRRQA